jgi:hypothetical protein
MVIDLRDGEQVDLLEISLRHRSMHDRGRELAAMKIDVVPCSEIPRAFGSRITACGIEVRLEHTGSLDDLIERSVDHCRLSGQLSDERSLRLDAVSRHVGSLRRLRIRAPAASTAAQDS